MGTPRVFISYSHESEDHRARVLELAQQLRRDGFDAWIDRFDPPPIKGWPHWMERQVADAQWVLLVCTETYRRRFDQREEPGQGRGVTWEGRLVRGELYSGADGADRFIPVTFSPDDTKHIPSPLAAATYYCLDRNDDYATLQRHMRREAEVTPQPVGESAEPPPASSVEPAHVQSPGARDDSPLETSTAVETSSEEIKTILIVAANRAHDEWLALGREVREIAAALRGATSVKFDVHIVWAADDGEFRASFLELDPHILHFCGHGSTSGPVLERTEPGAEKVAGKELQGWLKAALKGTRLEIAVLNFCDTQEMLDDLASTAPIVIGPIRRIVDEHAITFSSVFYAALASGSSGSLAYHLGRSAAEMTPVDPGPTRDVRPSPSVLMGQYGIRCTSDRERPVFTGPQPSSELRTLGFFASEPEDLPRQFLDHQLRSIVSIRRPPTPERFRIEQRWATRPLDFVHTLMTARPAMVHVTGYGASDGAFRFEHDRYRQGVDAPRQILARVLAAFHQHIECAVLMFNYSCRVADEIEDVLDHVIAVNGTVSNSAVLRFSELFYQMIWYRRSYQEAFEVAVSGLTNGRAAFTLRGCRLPRKAHPSARALSSARDVVLIDNPGRITD